jgi:predicted HTH domain antitoxin
LRSVILRISTHAFARSTTRSASTSSGRRSAVVYNVIGVFNETVEVNRATWSTFNVTLADGRNSTEPDTFRINDAGHSIAAVRRFPIRPASRQPQIHGDSLQRHMRNLQVRVDDEEIDDLDELAEEMRLSRSELARSALREGVRRLRAEKALARYLNLEFTLSRAARYAGVTIREMAELAAAKGIPFFRYSLDELRRDRERARAWSKG